jgi:hypothetical protein
MNNYNTMLFPHFAVHCYTQQCPQSNTVFTLQTPLLYSGVYKTYKSVKTQASPFHPHNIATCRVVRVTKIAGSGSEDWI